MSMDLFLFFFWLKPLLLLLLLLLHYPTHLFFHYVHLNLSQQTAGMENHESKLFPTLKNLWKIKLQKINSKTNMKTGTYTFGYRWSHFIDQNAGDCLQKQRHPKRHEDRMKKEPTAINKMRENSRWKTAVFWYVERERIEHVVFHFECERCTGIGGCHWTVVN